MLFEPPHRAPRRTVPRRTATTVASSRRRAAGPLGAPEARTSGRRAINDADAGIASHRVGPVLLC